MKAALLALAIFGLSLIPMTSHADNNCVKEADVKALMKQFHFSSQNPKIKKVENFNRCDLKSPVRMVIAGLAFLRDHADLGALNTPSVIGENAWTYFTNRISSFVFINNPSDCDFTHGLGTDAYVDKGPLVHVCDYAINNSTLDMAAILVHEARHVEDRLNGPSGFPHVDCKRGPLKLAEASCDGSFAEKGSYGIGTEYEIALSHVENLDPALRDNARAEALTDLFERFNSVPNGLEETALLQSVDGTISVFDGKSLASLGQVPFSSILVGRDEESLIFDSEAGTVQSFLLNEMLPEDQGDSVKVFTTSLDPVRRSTFIDALYPTDEYYCFLFSQSLRCAASDTSGAVFDLPLQTLQPLGFIDAAKSSLVHSKTPYLVAADGNLYELPVHFKDLMHISEASLKRTGRPFDYVKLAPHSSGGEYALSRGGELYYTPKGLEHLRPIGELKEMRFKSITAPYYWSASLLDL